MLFNVIDETGILHGILDLTEELVEKAIDENNGFIALEFKRSAFRKIESMPVQMVQYCGKKMDPTFWIANVSKECAKDLEYLDYYSPDYHIAYHPVVKKTQ